VRDVDASATVPTAVTAPSASEVAVVIVLAVREVMTAPSSVVDPLVREDAVSEEPRKAELPEEMLNPPSAEEEAVVLPLNKFVLLNGQERSLLEILLKTNFKGNHMFLAMITRLARHSAVDLDLCLL